MVIYRTYSFIQSVLLILFRLAYLTGIAIPLYHFNDNPVFTSIVAAVCFIFFILTGNEELIVYTDRIKYVDKSLFKIFEKKKFYKITDIKNIEISGNFTAGNEMYTAPIGGAGKALNRVVINFKNGRSESFETSIYANKLKRVVEEAGKLM